MSSMGIGNKPCLDIRPSADQISDRSISIAQLCKSMICLCCLKYAKFLSVFSQDIFYMLLSQILPKFISDLL